MVMMVEMMLMTIPMMPGAMVMTMATISPSEREFPRQISPYRRPSSLCLVSASKWWRKKYWMMLPTFLDQGEEVRRRGAGGGPQGPGAGPTCGPRWTAAPAPWQASPAHLRPPSLIFEENDFLNFLEFLGLRRTGVLTRAFSSCFQTPADKSP